MHTLDALRAGELAGTKRLNLACGLTEFPTEIYGLADTLEILDLSGNQLTTLPADLPRLNKLKIAFFSKNRFDHVPEVLSQCPQLSMVGFKANQIETVSDRALPPNLRWLILTDNRIERLPDTLGQLPHLQKLMLAGNRLTALPDLSACQRLELVRLSANRLQSLPEWVFRLPRLSWLAYAGNPCCPAWPTKQPTRSGSILPEADWADLQIGKLLGQGASGTIFEGVWEQPQMKHADALKVAIKLFKGEMTSDGSPNDEMAACITAGKHPNLVNAIAQVVNHPEGKAGLLLPLIPSDYGNLGGPPSLETCTRDTYGPETQFSLSQVCRIAAGIASAAGHLHTIGILHGDLYAHNILVDNRGDSLLGDFGAASRYIPSGAAAHKLERLEVRAFGCLLEELLDRCTPGQQVPAPQVPDQQSSLVQLRHLQTRCLTPDPAQRPSFRQVSESLDRLP
ncbi:MAG: protein kinase [Elainellaceae cyanobacterium]